jgi:hypothetical protein
MENETSEDKECRVAREKSVNSRELKYSIDVRAGKIFLFKNANQKNGSFQLREK